MEQFRGGRILVTSFFILGGGAKKCEDLRFFEWNCPLSNTYNCNLSQDEYNDHRYSRSFKVTDIKKTEKQKLIATLLLYIPSSERTSGVF